MILYQFIKKLAICFKRGLDYSEFAFYGGEEY